MQQKDAVVYFKSWPTGSKMARGLQDVTLLELHKASQRVFSDDEVFDLDQRWPPLLSQEGPDPRRATPHRTPLHCIALHCTALQAFWFANCFEISSVLEWLSPWLQGFG